MTKARVVTSDEEIDQAIKVAREYEPYRPKAVAVDYDQSSDRIIIDLANGVQVVVPRNLLQGLDRAKTAELRRVEIVEANSALHWPSLDVDLYVPALLDGIFGNRKWMAAIGASGGAAKSDAKRQAARINGKLGGRPRSKRPHSLVTGSGSFGARKRGDTLVGTLRQTYGESFAKGHRPDMRLDTLLEREGATSLSDYLGRSKKRRRS
jgi:hypothetical protein